MSDYLDEYRAGYTGRIAPINEGPYTYGGVAEQRIIAHIDGLTPGEFEQLRRQQGDFSTVQRDTSEMRVTDPETGGSKGKKLARFSSIPRDVLWELAEHFGKGESKYPNDPETGQPNWQKGYDWRLNVDALERHLSLWLQGEDVDSETGSNHLIAVIWHAMVLRWFQIHDKGKDFRP